MTIEYLSSLPWEITQEIFNHFTDADLSDLNRQALEHGIIAPTYEDYKNARRTNFQGDTPQCFCGGCNKPAEYFETDRGSTYGFCEEHGHIRADYVYMVTESYRDSLRPKQPLIYGGPLGNAPK